MIYFLSCCLENPFHCNCSMKWLQDSLWKSEWITNETFGYRGEPQCSFPVKGSLRTVNFCNLTTTGSPKTQSGTTVSTQLNNYTMPAPVTTDISLSNFKYENATSNPSPDYPIWPVGLLLSRCILAVAAIC